jgi:hypothetical protein
MAPLSLFTRVCLPCSSSQENVNSHAAQCSPSR